MDKQQPNIDELFRRKLENHQVKPSGLAWEKLDRQLGNKQEAAFPWLRIAASMALIFTMAALIWTSLNLTEELTNPVAEQSTEQNEMVTGEVEPETLDEIVEETIPTETPKAPVSEPAEEVTKPVAPRQAPPVQVEKRTTEEIRQPVAAIKIEEIQIPELEIPALEDQSLLLADADVVRVRIVSSGLSKEEEKETIIDELENKIEKVGNIFNKVDQGFADLQDAKNSLFATITSRKNKN
ncbi:hypothetical protein KI659_07715 [Litoribacter alkaliphilus]|uniref:Uncharacterized protein n=1 Tax=Litoribacter ruber TaxID=702568 RepID=A0AAP2CHM8_9BACT|nr:hypothetical protein [Litoribacter alkaliphilus]MBS9523899.1 hypothetical protein [Litoribacter alkaliphilus]